MKPCPFCAEQIQDNAIKCRYCGEFLDDRPRAGRHIVAGWPGLYGGFEYRSQAELWGWPLLHVAQGYDPRTGLPRVAKGIIAIGNIAIGLLAVGGFAVGGVAIGGVVLGLLAFGGIAFGGLAFGGIALALYLAIGGIAVSLMYAMGGLAAGSHAIDALRADAEFLRLLERWWPGIRDVFSGTGR